MVDNEVQRSYKPDVTLDTKNSVTAKYMEATGKLRRERDEAVRVIKALLLTLPEEMFEDAMDDMPRWIVDAMMAASKPENDDGR